MNMTQKERLYLIRWNSDGIMTVTSGLQIEAIRHSEGKWYGGQPQMTIIREATSSDLKQHPPKNKCEQRERDKFLKIKWKQLENVLFDETDSELVLAEDWWGFPKGTEREEIWHVFDEAYSKGIALLLYGGDK